MKPNIRDANESYHIHLSSSDDSAGFDFLLPPSLSDDEIWKARLFLGL